VFPGGNFDEDDGCHRVTAIRETFEETGLLLARNRVDAGSERSAFQRLDQDVLNRARQSILLGQMAFSKFLDDAGLTPAVDELLPFTEWITPVQVPRCDSQSSRRFDYMRLKRKKRGIVFVGGSMRGSTSPSCATLPLRPPVFLTGPNEISCPPLTVGRK
jgi:hypothetical protein